MVQMVVWCGPLRHVGRQACVPRLCCGVVMMELVGFPVVLGHRGEGSGVAGACWCCWWCHVPSPYRTAATVRRGLVRAAVPVWFAPGGIGAGPGCRSTAVVAGVGEGVAGGVLWGL